MSTGRAVAVVIPTVDEADRLPALLEDLRRLDATVVVADGGSTDGTPDVALSLGATVIESPRGRAAQLTAGAEATDEPWLFFLHADSRVPDASLQALCTFLEGAGEREYAHFRFGLSGDGIVNRMMELGQRIREWVTGLPYGDQGLVVSRTLYERAAGYPEWPILEDVGLLERLARHGERRPLSAELVTSPRRYEAKGYVRSWLRHAAIMGGYRLGASPERLARLFPRGRRPTPSRAPKRTVVVFAKAPRPGHVKTRLAADLGVDEAVRVYRALGEATVRSLRSGPDRVVVYVDPPHSTATGEVAAWLGTDRVEYRQQSGADLGQRMARALDECLRESDEVCIVGTDIPGLGSERVSEAFAALAHNDVVVGPATDGGYYLLGLRRAMPELFRDVPWSTSAVLATTLARARDVGASAWLLDPMTDVDTSVDVPPELLRA